LANPNGWLTPNGEWLTTAAVRPDVFAALRHTLAALLEKLLHAAQIAHERLELGQTHLGAERYHVSGKKHKKHHQCSFYD
jgi:hypothetical protein